MTTAFPHHLHNVTVIGYERVLNTRGQVSKDEVVVILEDDVARKRHAAVMRKADAPEMGEQFGLFLDVKPVRRPELKVAS